MAWSITDPKTRDRELRALVTAMIELKLSSGMTLTNGEEDELTVGGKTISVIPAYKWMLES